MMKTKTQSGMVLVTSLIYLLIVSLAAIAVFESASILAYGNTNAISRQQQFYLLEKELKYLEQKLLKNEFEQKNLHEQFENLNIIYSADYETFNQDKLIIAWKNEMFKKHKRLQVEGVIEFMGMREKADDDAFLQFRVSVMLENENLPLMLQSLMLIPMQIGDESENENVGKRIAWIDFMVNE